MKEKISIQLKAAFLLLVFSMNTMIGFACAVGIDMGFNAKHHDEEVTEIPIHVHADGNKHHHNNEPKKYGHNQSAPNHHDDKNASKKDDCCTNEIMQFQQSDKKLAAKTGINMPVFVAIINIFLGIDRFSSVESTSQQYIASYFHPPPPDIRIAIQSFQI